MTKKKYVVVCYSVHEREIASYDVFDDEAKAYDFIEEDAQKTYEEEYNNANEKDKDSIELEFDRGNATLSSYNGEYVWTWEVISVKC